MTTKAHPKGSRADFVIEAHAYAKLVDDHAERLHAATSGAIGRDTAAEMRRLADEIARLHVAVPPRGWGSTRQTVLDATRAITTIRSALRASLPDDPLVAAQLRKARPSGTRAVAKLIVELDAHVGLREQHRAAIGGLLDAAFDAHTARIRHELFTVGARKSNVDNERERWRDELTTRTDRLETLVRNVRHVLSILRRADSLSTGRSASLAEDERRECIGACVERR